MSQELFTLLALGGFKLTKFISNVTKINKELNPPQSAPQQESKNIVTCGDNSSHVLGLKWYHIDDTLVVSRGVNRELKNSITQRTVLSFVSSIFDPIGLVAPYTVRARLLLKKSGAFMANNGMMSYPLISRQNFLPGTLVCHL